jgi:hypothetical protein
MGNDPRREGFLPSDLLFRYLWARRGSGATDLPPEGEGLSRLTEEARSEAGGGRVGTIRVWSGWLGVGKITSLSLASVMRLMVPRLSFCNFTMARDRGYKYPRHSCKRHDYFLKGNLVGV